MCRSRSASPATLEPFTGSPIPARREFRRTIPANGRSVFRRRTTAPCCALSNFQFHDEGCRPIHAGARRSADQSARAPHGIHARELDYAIIMSGEIDMMLDDKTVHLKAGDVAVQQATNHAWLNHGKEPCRVIFVMMDSKEP